MKLSRSLLCSAFVYAVSGMLIPAAYAENYSNLPLGTTICVNPAEVSENTFLNIVSTENGGAVRVTEGTTTIQDSSFSSVYSLGLGGALYVGDSAEVILKGEVTFDGNAHQAEEKEGVYTGLYNDIYLGVDAALTIDNESGELVRLESGVASADASASIVKSGSGRAVIGAGADNSGFAGSIAVEAGAMELNADMTLASFSVEKGASVSVSGGTVGVGTNGEYAISIASTGTQAFLSDLSVDSTTLQGGTTRSGMICDAAVVINNTAEMTLTNLALQRSSVKLYSSANVSSVELDAESSLTVYGGTASLSGANVITLASLDSAQLNGLTVENYAHITFGFADELWDTLKMQSGLCELTFAGLTVEEGAELEFMWMNKADDGSNIYITSTSYTDSGVVLSLDIDSPAKELTWLNEKKAVWQEGAPGWITSDCDYANFTKGAEVSIGDGTVTIVGEVEPENVRLSPTKSLTFKSNKKTPGMIAGEDTTLSVNASNNKIKVTMNDGNTYGGGTTIWGGTVNATGATSFGSGEIVIFAGVLNMAGKAIENDVRVSGSATIKSGKKYTGVFTLACGSLLKGSQLNIEREAFFADETTINGTLSGNGTATIAGDVTLDANGKLTTQGLYITGNGILSAGTKGLAMNTKVSAITIEGGELNSAGKVAAYSLEMDDVATVTAGQMSMKDNIQLNESSTLNVSGKLDAYTMNLTDSKLNANGNVSLKGHLELSNSHVKLWDASPKNKAVSLSVKGDVNLFTKDNPLTPDVETLATSLTLSGALSATNLTLNGAILNLTGSKLQTVKVKNCLTLSGTNIINLAFNVTEKDVDKGKSFKLFTFKTSNLTSSSDLYALLGLDADLCTLSLDKKGTSILLTVKEYKAWIDYITPDTSEALLTTCAVEEEAAPVAEESAAMPIIETISAVDAALAKVSDTLVQTTWGAAKASRAFVGSIESRGQNATILSGGRGAAWGAALGSSSRLSSHGGAQGADYSMSGAAVGAEISATEKHSVGVAMGCTWGRVSTHSAYIADQDTTHFALYGSSSLKKTANGGLTLDWSAAYGRSENDADLVGADYDWTQHSAQLDARLSYARTLNEGTVVRAFGGLQYLHVDAATPTAGVKADSMENLRVELGVGATWMATGKTALSGEVSFIGDMLRDNPAAVVGGTCRGGANPGRAGVNVGVGATHQLNESWCVNAGYNLELVPHSTSHNASVGATYRF